MTEMEIKDPVEIHSRCSVWLVEPFLVKGKRRYVVTRTQELASTGRADMPVGWSIEVKSLHIYLDRYDELETRGNVTVLKVKEGRAAK